MQPTFPDVAGPLQMRVLLLLWQHGALTVSDVHERLNAEPGATKLAYTTILTVCRNLGFRGLCKQERGPVGQRRHTFTATITRAEYEKRAARWFVRFQFAGDAKAAAAAVAAAG